MTTLLIYSTTSPELAYERLKDFCVFDVMFEDERIKDKRGFDKEKITATLTKELRIPHKHNFPANIRIEVIYFPETSKDYKSHLELLLFNLENPRIFNLFGKERKIREL